MCDYSLHGIPNRLAVEGDKLVTHRFETGTVGMCAAKDLQPPEAPRGFWARLKERFIGPTALYKKAPCAVCVPPGATLKFKSLPQHFQKAWGVGEDVTVHFTQVTVLANMHRDAIRLPNGREILLQQIREGLWVDVMSLGGDKAETMPVGAVRPISLILVD